MDGQCRKGLICKVDEEEQNKLPAGNEATGTCQRKPRGDLSYPNISNIFFFHFREG